MKNILKLFITDYKKITLYGDKNSDGVGFYRPFIGKCIKVKLFGIFWIKYKTRYWKKSNNF